MTGVRPIRKPSTETIRCGVSSSSGGYARAGSIPIGNGPAGIATQSITPG